VTSGFSHFRKGAIGFDWVTAGKGGVPWLISWPRKKLIKQQLPKIGSSHWLHKPVRLRNPCLRSPTAGHKIGLAPGQCSLRLA